MLNIQTMNFKCLLVIPPKKKQVNGIGWNIPGAFTGNEWGIWQDATPFTE